MNTFVGPIPDDIDKLSASLQHLDLSANNFTGDVSRSIGGLKELTTLYLTNNLLDGTFPSEIANLSKLEDLQMPWNPFTPTALPSDWGKLKNLKSLFMAGCNLVGEIPESFGGMESLEHLDLTANHLVGSIPNGLFLLKDLSYLYLYKNKLSGPIPSLVLSLNLKEIDLSQNHLSGSIPEDFGNLKSLQILNLFKNRLTGQIPTRIGLLPELETVKLFFNNISGTLPPQLGLHSRLVGLEIGGNNISGPLPEKLCSKGALRGITAFSNKLSGEIPNSLENCTALRTLMLQNNNFTGEIPSGIWTCPNLYSLFLSSNGFTGQFPDLVASNMIRIDVKNNKLSGEIPATIGSWKNIQVFDAGNNMLSGSLPLGLTSLSRLSSLSLEGNQLSGELPIKTNSWQHLNTLDLSRNKFSGPIPASFSSLQTLNYLDLSSNDLSGEIPPQFEDVSFTFLNLSNNKLSGQIPNFLDNGAFANSFLNTSLCTSDKTKILELPRCSTSFNSSSSKHLSFKYLTLILVLAVILFLVTLYFTVYAIKEMRQRKHNSELTSWKLTSFQRLEFTEYNIISSLSEHNVIGSGGSGKVYRVQVDNSGYSVAAKKIWNNQKLNNSQFLAEVQILGTIRHTNIVKLLCCISSENSKLLVYEYLENQSLDRWLYGRRKLETKGSDVLHVLDWPTRLRIAIGAAQGLCYMHHDCSPPIIHRDVKSSNILLDSKFNAKIADFGLAKTTVKEGELHTMSNIAGSFGYLAPEYQYTTKVNEKIDVYSFGVVLLELTTGKEPNGVDESLNLAEWSWKNYSEDKPIVEALDEEIKEGYCVGEMSSVFKLGLVCTSPLPDKRPSMREVLQVLCQYSPLEEDARKTNMERTEHDVPPLLVSMNNKNGSRRVVQDAMDMV